MADKNDEKRKLYREQYSNVIRKKRKRRNMTQKELAEEIGVTDATISRYEKGELEMPASLLPLISDVCSFWFADYMADLDLVLLSKRLDEIDMYDGHIRKAAYPLPEWDVEYCRREREQMMEELKECLAQSNSSELVFKITALTEVIDSGVNRSHY